jgi:RES domain-containing protein
VSTPEVVGWRIVKAKHASTAFSGEGARLFEGRWNSSGVRVVYCSEHLSLAALEILVHTRPVRMPDKFRVFRVMWNDTLMISLKESQLAKGWNAASPGPASKRIGNDWIEHARSAVLALPSVIIPLERTFLLNPGHRDFRKIKITDGGDFFLDPRLPR